MPTGIRMFRPDGTLLVNYSDRIFKMLGVAQVGQTYTGTQASGTIQHGLLNAYAANRPFAFVMGGQVNVGGEAIQFSFSGDVLTWLFPKSGSADQAFTRPDTTFAFGIY